MKELKTQTWGVGTYFNDLHNFKTRQSCRDRAREEAIEDYRKNRENGEYRDTPDMNGGKLPEDGYCSWIKDGVPNGGGYYDWEVKYYEGIKDKEWMDKKDQKLLKRMNGEEEKLKAMNKHEMYFFKNLYDIKKNYNQPKAAKINFFDIKICFNAKPKKLQVEKEQISKNNLGV